MDRRLLHYYNRELQHLREMGGEFAREFPKIAGRLGLDEFACVDPYVERLLEGFAFLAARVELKLDAEFPRFTQSLLETVYPHYQAPTPSMVIAQFELDKSSGSSAEGFSIPRNTILRSIMGKGDRTACEYRTSHDVTLWPLQVTEAQYHTRDLASLDVPRAQGARAGIRVRIECLPGLTFGELSLDELTFHLRGVGDTPVRVYEQLLGRSASIVIQPAARPVRWREVLGRASIRQVGFEDDQALLPYDSRSFQGYRLVKEYFAFPQRYMFVELTGLSKAVQRCEGGELDIIILTQSEDLELEGKVDSSTFALFCTPAVNLFPKRADRIHLSDRFSEFHVVPDRTRPLDFEVYRVLGVTGHGTRPEEEQDFRPFYSASDLDADTDGGGAYYVTNRIPRTASAREKQFGRRSSYAGSEVFVSLVDSREAPYRSDLRQLEVRTMCTNRDLPLQMPVGVGPTDFTLEIDAPVEATRCLSGPTPPRPSPTGGEIAWRAISHLSLNYLSLGDKDPEEGASALRDLLRLYSGDKDPQTQKQVDGIKRISTRPTLRRVGEQGPIAFARGLEVTVLVDESAFEGTGAFLIGAVLERFFAKYVSINSFTETVVSSLQRAEVMRWPARIGRKQVL